MKYLALNRQIFSNHLLPLWLFGGAYGHHGQLDETRRRCYASPRDQQSRGGVCNHCGAWCNHGADVGRVWAGIQVPPQDHPALQDFLAQVGYPAVEESTNPAYRFFLSTAHRT